MGTSNGEKPDLDQLAINVAQILQDDKSDKGLRAYSLGNDPRLIAEYGPFIFYSAAVAEFIQNVGGDPVEARNALRRVLGVTLPSDSKHTIMHSIATHFANSMHNNGSRSLSGRLHEDVAAYVRERQEIVIYAMPAPTSAPDTLNRTPKAYIPLQTYIPRDAA